MKPTSCSTWRGYVMPKAISRTRRKKRPRRLRYASHKSGGTSQDDLKEALEKASEALVITERSGYVLQGADVNLFLAQYALEQEKDKVKAKEYAESALKLAYCDGPPYYYKVAYEEAVKMLERLKV